MPSCLACNRWFSEEDSNCGCPGELVYMTNGLLSSKLAAAKAEARRKALMDLGRRFKDYDGSDSLTVEEAVARIEDLAQEADHA